MGVKPGLSYLRKEYRLRVSENRVPIEKLGVRGREEEGT
jgi:hypothetical protein